jgi:hypothetical protein
MPLKPAKSENLRKSTEAASPLPLMGNACWLIASYSS